MSRMPITLLLTPALLAGCASGPHAGPATPVILPEPANARARLYADCVGAAAQAGTVQRYGRYVRFTCQGAPADRLFNALEMFSRTRGQESVSDGHLTRRISSTSWDDQCWSTSAAGQATAAVCIIHLPVGDFLDPEKDAVPPKR